MRADQRKFHYIYKITRTDGSGKYYIGMHSTDNLEDGYFGSGTQLAHSIRRHGKEKHAKEILEFLPDRKSLKAREKELVDEEIINDPLCMNLKLGGEGGGKFWSEEHRTKCTQASLKKINARFHSGSEAVRTRNAKSAETLRTRVAKGAIDYGNGRFHGRKHSPETIEKMKASHAKRSANKIQPRSSEEEQSLDKR